MSSVLSYKNYHANVEFSAEDNLLVGHVIGIVDVLAFHAENTEDIVTKFHECIDSYLEMCEKTGKNPDKEFKGDFNVRISPEKHRRAAIEAAKQGISLNRFVDNAITAACGL